MSVAVASRTVNPADLRGLRKLLDRRAPGVVVYLSVHPNAEDPTVIIHLISVAPTQRGYGLGDRVLGLICQTADAFGWTLALTPVSDFGSDLTRLTRWYMSAGFIPGRLAKQTMIRRCRA